MKTENDIVVTGMGMVCPIGVGVQPFTQSLIDRKSGIKLREEYANTDWPFRIGGVVDDFDPKQYVKPRKSLKLMCREIQFGFGAAQMAVEDAALPYQDIDSERIGIVCGSDTFYCDPAQIADSFWKDGEGVTEISEWIERAMRTVEPLWMLKYLPNMTASHVAISIDAQGPNNTIIQGDASGLLALIEAADAIRRGWADVMLVGGSGSKINPSYISYHGIDTLATPGDDPTSACRPFDKNRTGTVGSEGAGMFVIERRKHAEARGARIYGKLASFEYGFISPQSENQAESQSRLLEKVVARAELEPANISHVNSHASGEIVPDATTAQAIHSVFNDVDVVAYKSFFGNVGPAGGIIETAVSLRSLAGESLPGSLNFESSDETCPVNVLTETCQEKQSVFVKTSASNSGQFVAVAFAAE